MTCCPDGFSLTNNIVLAFRLFPRSLPNDHVNPWREEKDAKGLTPKEGLVEEPVRACPCIGRAKHKEDIRDRRPSPPEGGRKKWLLDMGLNR